MSSSANTTARARVNETARSQVAAENALDNIADVLQDVEQNDASKYDIPSSGFTVGKYLPTDDYGDRKWATYFGIKDVDGDVGQKQFDFESWFAYTDQRMKDAQYRDFLNLGAQMINAKDPASRERAFAIMPELHSVPALRAQKLAALQMKLHWLLVQGEITSRQDLEFLFQLLRPDSVIPLAPIWADMLSTNDNLRGVLAKALLGKDATALPDQMQFKRGWYWLFNPRSFKSNANSDPALDNDPQLELKIIIAKRLLPNLRDAPDKAVAAYLKNISRRTVTAAMQKDMNVMLDQVRSGGQTTRAGSGESNAYSKDGSVSATRNLF